MINKLFSNIRTILNLMLAWFISLLLYYSIIYLTLDEVGLPENSFSNILSLVVFLSILFGLMNGILEITIFRTKFNRIKFSLVVFYKTTLIIVVFVISVIIFISVKNYVFAPLGITLGEPPQEDEIISFFSSLVFYKHGGFVIIMSFMINFFFQLKSKMGKGVLFNLFIGKYHFPRQEERIIMFLDLTSATTIAEEMAISKYSQFLQDFFSEIDDAINQTKGAIFQFVGDEIVILWENKDGIENNNCIKFFFLAQKKIFEQRDLFLKKYNAVPEFKAGIHSGSVVITEVGVTKQEIAYHGDTVNTAARIRSVCNDAKRKLLISAELLSQLPSIDENYEIEHIGLSNLKGKKNIIGLISIEEKK